MRGMAVGRVGEMGDRERCAEGVRLNRTSFTRQTVTWQAVTWQAVTWQAFAWKKLTREMPRADGSATRRCGLARPFSTKP